MLIVTSPSLPSPKYELTCEGRTDKYAHVPHISVQFLDSVSVDISTLPEEVVSALVVVPDANAAQAQEIYCCRIQSAVLYITIPFVGDGIQASRAVASA